MKKKRELSESERRSPDSNEPTLPMMRMVSGMGERDKVSD